MWMDEKEISEQMYKKCFRNDQEKYWSLITDSAWSYYYCKNVKDRPEVRKFIIESEWAYFYCRFVEDKPEVRKYIKSGWGK